MIRDWLGLSCWRRDMDGCFDAAEAGANSLALTQKEVRTFSFWYSVRPDQWHILSDRLRCLSSCQDLIRIQLPEAFLMWRMTVLQIPSWHV
ncbi:hypothetical protein CDV31_012681 [Fusarium ambrosium]|uniref:Uncharacterized protein n=1 Tax=Fusarium ambrosium TaxID=131363 RepID=A0A428T8E0_9HYPO|nr:hypothetical protein CDV31_012681 [Fusarium ambrosium]